MLREIYLKLQVLGNSSTLSILDIYIKLLYETFTSRGKPITRQRLIPIVAIASTYAKQVPETCILLSEDELSATFKNAYLLISNRVDTPECAAESYNKRWMIEVFYRTTKQNLGLTSCYARS